MCVVRKDTDLFVARRIDYFWGIFRFESSGRCTGSDRVGREVIFGCRFFGGVGRFWLSFCRVFIYFYETF